MLNELDIVLMESLDKEDTLDMVEDAQMDEVFDEVA